MPASSSRYCVIAVHYADTPATPEYLMVDGQLVVFDTLYAAQSVLPRLFAGRLHRWDADKETLYGMELTMQGFNRLSIWKGYDPYDVPNGFRAKGVWSEAESRDWKHHVPYFHVLQGLTAWADKLEVERMERQSMIQGAA